MKQTKFLLCIIIIAAYELGFAQQNLPIVRSNSKDIIIKFNGAVTNWYLIPEKKPDVFSIGSTLKKKTVQFNTGIDSISYTVEPGQHYDFIILLDNKTECYTRISAMKDPIFFNKKIAIPFSIAIVLALFFAYYKRKFLPTKLLLLAGIITPLFFWTVTIIGGFLHSDYNHFKNTVSELGTIGARSEVFMSVTTMLLAILSLYFSIGFYRACKKAGLNLIPAVLSVSMANSFAWAAVFPSGNELHGSLGPLPVLVMLGALLGALLWRAKYTSSIRIISLISLAIMLLFVLRFIPAVQMNFSGLVQRFLYLGWSVWFISLSIWLRKLMDKKILN